MLGDMALDVPELLLPATAVRFMRDGLPGRRERLESGLGHGEEGSARRVLESELHQGRGLLRVVDLRVDGGGVPAKAEEALGLHPFNQGGHGQVLVPWIGDGAVDLLPGLELATEGNPEPLRELTSVGEGTPDTSAW